MTERSAQSLAPEAEAAGFRLQSLDTTESTNDEALQCALSGDPGPLWIVARQQTRGRGRHGRVWSSPPGNIYASLLLTEPCDPKGAPEIGFVAGLALHDAVAAVSGLTAPRLALKWPNDLLLDGGKLAGILLEGHQVGAPSRFVVIVGIGLNVAAAPQGAPYRASSLAEAAGPVALDAMMRALTAAMALRLAEWGGEAGGQGFGRIRDAWLQRAGGVGKAVTVRLPRREAHGIFAGLDSSGRLLLDGEHGREAIDAGDLFFGAGSVGSAT